MKTVAKLETITPARATVFLNHNKGNRHLRDGVVEKYAHDMKTGAWTHCVAPIAFYEDGEIADGQHRLWAIVESKTAQKFYVIRKLDRASGLNIDTGISRTLVDNARISGLDSSLTATLASWCRATEDGDRQKYGTKSNADRLAMVAKHREAVTWAMSNTRLKGKLFRNAIAGAAMARAWYVEGDKARLESFGQVLCSGFGSGDEDSAAIAMRNYILTHKATNSSMWRDTFLKMQNALWYFMRRKHLHIIKGQSEERYPLVKEKSKK